MRVVATMLFVGREITITIFPLLHLLQYPSLPPCIPHQLFLSLSEWIRVEYRSLPTKPCIPRCG